MSVKSTEIESQITHMTRRTEKHSQGKHSISLNTKEQSNIKSKIYNSLTGGIKEEAATFEHSGSIHHLSVKRGGKSTTNRKEAQLPSIFMKGNDFSIFEKQSQKVNLIKNEVVDKFNVRQKSNSVSNSVNISRRNPKQSQPSLDTTKDFNRSLFNVDDDEEVNHQQLTEDGDDLTQKHYTFDQQDINYLNL